MIIIHQIKKIIVKNACGPSYKLFIMIEYIQSTLQEKLNELLAKNQRMNAKQCWTLLKECFQSVKQINSQFYSINKIDSNNVLINKNGQYKVLDNGMIGRYGSINRKFFTNTQTQPSTPVSQQQIQQLGYLINYCLQKFKSRQTRLQTQYSGLMQLIHRMTAKGISKINHQQLQQILYFKNNVSTVQNTQNKTQKIKFLQLSGGPNVSQFGDSFKYKGTYKNGKYHGPGQLQNLKVSNINVSVENVGKVWKQCFLAYQGNFQNGLMQGFGSLIFQNNRKLMGQFQQGRISGFGTFVNQRGQRNLRRWVNDQILPAD